MTPSKISRIHLILPPGLMAMGLTLMFDALSSGANPLPMSWKTSSKTRNDYGVQIGTGHLRVGRSRARSAISTARSFWDGVGCPPTTNADLIV
jgi:hypothetical protein